MLSVENLNVFAGERQLVKNVSFRLDRGEVLALVGESGSGKSLTCLSLLSLLDERLRVDGRITYTEAGGEAEDITRMDPATRSRYALKKIAYVFQEPLSALNPVQTCGKQMDENLRLCGYGDKTARKAAAADLLKKVGLDDTERILHSYPFRLSGGQRQRVMIAMAMAGDPELIVADEPTTALDVLLQDEILGLLRDLCVGSGRSLLLVSHDLDLVQRYADRVAVMYRGEVVETGTARKVITEPAHPYTRALLACKPRPSGRGYRLATLRDAGTPDFHPEPFPVEPEKGDVLLRTEGLVKTYKGENRTHTALDHVSFSLKKGSSTGLIGESGSGKSTVSRLLVGLEEESEGRIVYDFRNGKPLSSNVQMIFQDPFAALNPALSAGDMLTEVIRKHTDQTDAKAALKMAAGLLEKVGLNADDLRKYPSSFSGGQRQRLCIARALAARPSLLICDESTSALDLSVQAQILNLLKDLQISEQLTLLMITHSMAVAAWFCSELIVLRNGVIVEQGSTADLLGDPQHEYTRAMAAHAGEGY